MTISASCGRGTRGSPLGQPVAEREKVEKMAQLPGERYLMQQQEGEVVLFDRYTEEEVVRYDPSDGNAGARAQKVIHDSEVLTAEEKCFAHFWAGYFYAHARGA
jgi:hypothetical protein